MIRVCIVDDHELVRRGIREILSDSPDVQVADEAATGEELLTKAVKRRWDVLLLDLSMPGQGGLETLKLYRAQHPNCPVLVLTMHSEDQYAVRAIKLGASGYLTKDAAPERLVEAIRKVASGAHFITPEVAGRLAVELGENRKGAPHETLSNREYQVFRMIAQGETVTRIAEKLGLSAKTISTNRARMLRKLGLRNNAEVVYYAIKHQVVKVPDGV